MEEIGYAGYFVDNDGFWHSMGVFRKHSPKPAMIDMLKGERVKEVLSLHTIQINDFVAYISGNSQKRNCSYEEYEDFKLTEKLTIQNISKFKYKDKLMFVIVPLEEWLMVIKTILCGE